MQFSCLFINFLALCSLFIYLSICLREVTSCKPRQGNGLEVFYLSNLILPPHLDLCVISCFHLALTYNTAVFSFVYIVFIFRCMCTLFVYFRKTEQIQTPKGQRAIYFWAFRIRRKYRGIDNGNQSDNEAGVRCGNKKSRIIDEERWKK